MTKTLQNQFGEALAQKEALVERHANELSDLTKIQKSIKKYDILWNEKVTSKNAQKTIQLVKILSAFNLRLSNVKAYDDLSDVKMSTHQLWMFTQHGSVSSNNGPTVRFRGYLNDLKSKQLLSFNDQNRKWSLTEAAINRLKKNG